MNYSNEYIAELLKEVFSEKDFNNLETKTRLVGKIPDIVLNFDNGVISPNNYEIKYSTGVVGYTDSGKDHGIYNIDSIKEDCAEYKPFLYKTNVYTDEKCSFNVKNENGFSLVINSPFVNGENITDLTDDLSHHACGEVLNNEHVYLLQPGEEVTSKLFKNIDEDKVITAFNSEICVYDEGSPPYIIDILTKDNKGASVAFKNNPEANTTNSGYTIGNIEVRPCVDGANKPYIKYNDEHYGKSKFHAETKCDAEIEISLSDNPTQERPWDFDDFAAYTKYTNYTGNPATTPTILVDNNLRQTNLRSNEYGKLQVDGKNISNANVNISINTRAGEIVLEPNDNTQPLHTGNLVILPCDDKRPYIWYRDEDDGELHPMNQTECPTNGCKITIAPNDELTREFPWQIKEDCVVNHYKREAVAYILISDYLSDSGFEDVDSTPDVIENSLSYGNLFSVNYGTDSHGIYYHTNGKTLEELDESRMLNEGTVISKISELCNDNIKLTLLRLENQQDSIIFYRNIYDIDTNDLIETEEYDLTAPSGRDDRHQALYLLSKNIDNDSREIAVNLTEKFIYTNSDDDAGIEFSSLDLPIDIFLTDHEMHIGCCSDCAIL